MLSKILSKILDTFTGTPSLDECRKDRIARGWSGNREFEDRYWSWWMYCPCGRNCTITSTFAPLTRHQLNTAVLEWVGGTSPGNSRSL